MIEKFASAVWQGSLKEGGPTVKKAHLVTKVKADAPEAKIRDLAEKAKAGCPISKLLRAEITMEVTVG